MVEDCLCENGIPRGLFNKISYEGVSRDFGRWIKLERAGLKEKKKKKQRERKRDGAQTRVGEEYGGHHGRPLEGHRSRADGELRCTVFYFD